MNARGAGTSARPIRLFVDEDGAGTQHIGTYARLGLAPHDVEHALAHDALELRRIERFAALLAQ